MNKNESEKYQYILCIKLEIKRVLFEKIILIIVNIY